MHAGSCATGVGGFKSNMSNIGAGSGADSWDDSAVMLLSSNSVWRFRLRY